MPSGVKFWPGSGPGSNKEDAMNELVKSDSRELARVATPMEMIAAIARDPSIPIDR